MSQNKNKVTMVNRANKNSTKNNNNRLKRVNAKKNFCKLYTETVQQTNEQTSQGEMPNTPSPPPPLWPYDYGHA